MIWINAVRRNELYFKKENSVKRREKVSSKSFGEELERFKALEQREFPVNWKSNKVKFKNFKMNYVNRALNKEIGLFFDRYI